MRGKLDLDNSRAFEPVNVALPSPSDIKLSLYGDTARYIATCHTQWQKERFIAQWTVLVNVFADLIHKETQYDIRMKLDESEMYSVADSLIIGIAQSIRNPNDGLLPDQNPIVFSQLKSSLEAICVYCLRHPNSARTQNVLTDLSNNVGYCGPALFSYLQQAAQELYQPTCGLYYWLAHFRTLIVRQYANQYVIDESVSGLYQVHPYIAFLDYAEIQRWHLLVEVGALQDYFSNRVIPKESAAQEYAVLDIHFKERYASEALSYLAQCTRSLIIEKFNEHAVDGKLSSANRVAFNLFFEEIKMVLNSFQLSIEPFLTPDDSSDDIVCYRLNEPSLSLMEVYLAVCLYDLNLLEKQNLRVLGNKQNNTITLLFPLTKNASFIVQRSYTDASRQEKQIVIPFGCIRFSNDRKLHTLTQYIKEESMEKLLGLLCNFLVESHEMGIPLFLTLLKREPCGMELCGQLLQYTMSIINIHFIGYHQLCKIISYLVNHVSNDILLTESFYLKFFASLFKDFEQMDLLKSALHLARQAPQSWHFNSSLEQFFHFLQVSEKIFRPEVYSLGIVIVIELSVQLQAAEWLRVNHSPAFLKGSSPFWWCCRLFSASTCLTSTVISLVEHFLEKIPANAWGTPIDNQPTSTPLHFFCVALRNNPHEEKLIVLTKKMIDRLPVETWLTEFEQTYNSPLPRGTDEPSAQRRRGEGSRFFEAVRPFQVFLRLLLRFSNWHSMTAIDKLSILLRSPEFSKFLINHLGINDQIQDYFREKYHLQPISQRGLSLVVGR